MRVGILSYTHNEIARTIRAVELLSAEGAEVLIHCGDLTIGSIVAACSVMPSYFVLGNHDADNVPELQRAATEYGACCLGWGGVIELAGKKIGVAHGHMRLDVQSVLSQQPDYLLSGHSHFPVDEMSGTVRRINPGALFRATEFTVALLDLTSDVLRFLPIAR
jgi:putative phosphoesterase